MKSIKSNFIWNTILKVSAIVFPLIIYPYVSRKVGVEGIGRVSFASSVIAYFSIVSQLGIPTYGVRAIAQVAEDKDALSKTTQEILRINIVTTIIAYIALFISIDLIPRFQADRKLILITSAEMLFNTIGMVWLFSGLEQYSYITIRSLVFKVLSLILIFVFVHTPNDYIAYGTILVFSIIGSNILNLIYSKKFISYKRFPTYDYKKHITSIMVFFMMSVATTVYTSLDTIMLGFLSGNTDVGLYTSATKIRSVLLGVINALAIVMLPRSSYYIKHQMKEAFVKLSQIAFHFIVIMATATFIYFSIFARESILLLSGNEFADATYPMLWIMPTVLICGISNLTAIQMLVSLGKEKAVLFTQIVGAIIDFVLNLVLIPRYGASAAAAATMIAELIIMILQIHILHIEGIWLKGNLKLHKILLSSLVAVLLSVWVKCGLHMSPFYTLLFSSVLFFAGYCSCLYLMKDDVFRKACKDLLNMVSRKLKG